MTLILRQGVRSTKGNLGNAAENDWVKSHLGSFHQVGVMLNRSWTCCPNWQSTNTNVSGWMYNGTRVVRIFSTFVNILMFINTMCYRYQTLLFEPCYLESCRHIHWISQTENVIFLRLFALLSERLWCIDSRSVWSNHLLIMPVVGRSDPYFTQMFTCSALVDEAFIWVSLNTPPKSFCIVQWFRSLLCSMCLVPTSCVDWMKSIASLHRQYDCQSHLPSSCTNAMVRAVIASAGWLDLLYFVPLNPSQMASLTSSQLANYRKCIASTRTRARDKCRLEGAGGSSDEAVSFRPRRWKNYGPLHEISFPLAYVITDE